MRLLYFFCIFFIIPILSPAQNVKPFAIWENQSTNDYYFVQLDATTGLKFDIHIIPGMTAFVSGNKTSFNTDSNYCYLVGLIGSTPHLFTIDASTGATIYNPVFSDNVVGLEYSCKDSTLYGLRVTGSVYDLVKVDYINGVSTSISNSLGINAYVGESFTLDRIRNLYSFIALAGSDFYLQSYSIPGGNLVYNNLFPDNLTGFNYSCADSAIFALWENNNQYLLERVDPISGTHSTVSTLSGVTPGYTAESSCIHALGIYVYRGFDAMNNFSLISVNCNTGQTINVIQTSDNAVGFQSGICCFDTTNISTSAELFEPKINISVIPNPAHDRIKLKTDKTILTGNLFSADGIKLFTLAKNHDSGYDISSLKPGFYFIEIFFEDRSFTSVKFLVE